MGSPNVYMQDPATLGFKLLRFFFIFLVAGVDGILTGKSGGSCINGMMTIYGQVAILDLTDRMNMFLTALEPRPAPPALKLQCLALQVVAICSPSSENQTSLGVLRFQFHPKPEPFCPEGVYQPDQTLWF